MEERSKNEFVKLPCHQNSEKRLCLLLQIVKEGNVLEKAD